MDPLNEDWWRGLDEKSQQRLAAALEQRLSGRKKIWYCQRGRNCDGRPHDDIDYSHARSDQWPPPGTDWLTWLLSSGRGSGKTRSGAEWGRKKTETVQRGGILGPNAGHVRDVMVEGDSGLLAVFDNAKVRVKWEPSKKRLTVLENEAVISTYSGEEPELLRGRQHGWFWVDEPAHIPLIEDVWDNMLLGLRLGKHPQICATTTPLPKKWIKDLEKDPDTRTVRVSTYVNLDNLAPSFRKVILSKYEGTRLGRQELHGEVLEDIEGALWTWAMIEDHRAVETPYESMDKIVVAVDPAGTVAQRDETGIVVVGRLGDHLYVFEDASGHYTPKGWAKKTWHLVEKYEADFIVAEKNYGGEMVRSTLTNVLKEEDLRSSMVKLVNSRRGKVLRADPIVGTYEQERVHHVGAFTDLENQMTQWVPGLDDSPDRVDALVHGATFLSKAIEKSTISSPFGDLVTMGTPLVATDSPHLTVIQGLRTG